MKNILIFTMVLAFSFSFAALAASAANNPSLSLSQPVFSGKVGDTFKVNIIADPGSDKVDTIRADLSYTPGMLEIANVSKNSSFSYTSGGNQLDNKKGTFSYGAGMPGGTSVRTLYMTLVFKAKKEGRAQIKLSGNSMMLSSGDNLFTADGTGALNIDITKTGNTKNPTVNKPANGMYPDGTLIRSKDWKVYIINGGKRKKISSPAELKKYGTKKIINVDDATLNAYPLVQDSPDSASPSKLKRFGDGNLLRNAANKKVYIVGGGLKKQISSPDDLRKYAGRKIYDVSERELSEYPLAINLKMGNKAYANGKLLKDSTSGSIYIITRGEKKRISNLAELKKYGGKRVVNVSAGVLNAYPTIL